MPITNVQTGLASEEILEAFFATITYRLEPDGRGTRFPVVQGDLYFGRMPAGRADEAIRELTAIGNELKKLPPSKAVWDMQLFEPRDDSRLPVNRSAANLAGYFVTQSNQPLLLAVQDWALQARAGMGSSDLRPGLTQQRRFQYMVLIGGGLVWSAIGYRFFPNAIMVPAGSHDNHGPLIWPMGLIAIFVGIAGFLTEFLPPEAQPARMKPNTLLVVAVVGLLIFGYFDWR
jgi:2,3-bisphosphoglycerate-dependent phosphoglycerate mutase